MVSCVRHSQGILLLKALKGWIPGSGRVLALCGRVCLCLDRPLTEVHLQLHWEPQDLRGHGEKLRRGTMRENESS